MNKREWVMRSVSENCGRWWEILGIRAPSMRYKLSSSQPCTVPGAVISTAPSHATPAPPQRGREKNPVEQAHCAA